MEVFIKEVSEPRYIIELSVTKEELQILGEIGNHSAKVARELSVDSIPSLSGKYDEIECVLRQLWEAEWRFRGVLE